MTSTYTTRKRKAILAETRFEAYLERKQYRWMKSGVENLFPERIALAIAELSDHHPALLHVRFLPDYQIMIVTPQKTLNVWCDVKASKHIERSAFEHYLELDQTRPTYLALVLPQCESIYMVRVSDIQFEQDEWQIGNRNGSGDPFKTIDLLKTPHTIVGEK